MGLGALYGASGIDKEMRARVLQRLAEQQAQQQMDLALRGAGRADQELELRRQELTQRGEYQKAQLASIEEARQAAADAANELRIGRKTGLMTPGQTLTGADAADLPGYLKQDEPQRELEAPPGIAAGEQGQPIAGTIASSPSIVGRRFVYTGTGPQRVAQQADKYQDALINSLPEGSRERRALEYERATGKSAPSGLFDPKASKVTTQSYILKGQPIVAQENDEGRITYRGKDVTDQVTPYHAPTAGADDTTDLSPAGLDAAALNYAKTGILPPLGMGDRTTRKKIINRAAEMMPGLDIASAKADFAANQASLTALQKQRDAVGAFEETALKNLDVFMAAAAKIPDTGSPILNRPLRALTGQGMGSAELAAYETARRTVVPEFAKILSNPSLAGQLSDSARREIDHIMAGDATLAQIKATIKVLKQDTTNRRTSYDDQISGIRTRIKLGQQTETPGSGDAKDPLGLRK